MGRDPGDERTGEAERLEAAAAATEARLERRREQIDLTAEEQDGDPAPPGR